jgi:preprotein translocase subunit SecB
MATTNGGPNPQGAFLPAINVLSQYIKDLSFENPNAPDSMRGTGPHPTIKVEFNVSAKPVTDGHIEVELKIEARAAQEEKVLFNIDLTYAGVFRVQNIPQEALQPLILIECPRLLFPFARQIVSEVTQSGGFPPLLVDPVDFARLYQERFMSGQGQSPSAQAN